MAGPCSGVRRHRSAGAGVTTRALYGSPHTPAHVALCRPALRSDHGTLAPERKGWSEAQTQSESFLGHGHFYGAGHTPPFP